MDLTFNGKRPKSVKYNGTDVNSVYYKNKLVWNKPIWVACNSYSTYIWYSYNGLDWNKSADKMNRYAGEARFSNGRWVTGGLYYSDDGIHWNAPSFTSSNDEYYARGLQSGNVTCFNGLWIVSGKGDNGSVIVYSDDGMRWSKGTISTLRDEGFSSAHYAVGVWVITCSEGAYWSTDGKNWTKGLSARLGNASARYANGIWVTGGYDGTYWSTDGKNWTKSANYAIEQGARFADGKWVACTNSDVYVSTDGKSWTRTLSNANYYNGAHYANGLWVGCSRKAVDGIRYSENGSTWIRATMNKRSWELLATQPDFYWGARYANGLWIAISRTQAQINAGVEYGYLCYSTDGKDWNYKPNSSVSIGGSTEKATAFNSSMSEYDMMMND